MSLVVLAAASWIAGNGMLRSIPMKGAESLVFRFLAGLSACAVVIMGAGSVSLEASRFLLNAFALAGLGYHLYRYKESVESDPPRERIDAVEWLCLFAAVAALALALFGALAPATSWDACVAHLALAKDYAREGRILFVPGNEYTAYPHLLHALYAYVFAQDGERGTMLLSWLMGLLACAATFVLGARIAGRRCGLIAAAILATAPIFLDQSSTVSIDLGFCAFAIGATAALTAWFDTCEVRSRLRIGHFNHPSAIRTAKSPVNDDFVAQSAVGWLALAAWLAGSACGIRHTGYLICVLLALAVPWGARQRRARALFVFAGATMLAASPWLLRSALVSGNPFYPLLASWFGTGALSHWPLGLMTPHPSVNGFGLRKLLMFPWDIVMRPHLFDGWSKSPGGLVILLGIPGAVIGGKRARTLALYALAGVVCLFYVERHACYVLPFFIPMMVVAGIAACRLTTLRHVVAVVLAAAFAFGLALDVAATHFKAPVVLGWETPKTYLAKRVERFPAFEWVNQHVPLDDTVFTFDQRSYFFDGRTYQNDGPLRAFFGKPVATQAAWMAAQSVKWIFLPVTYMEKTPGYKEGWRDMTAAWRHENRFFLPVKIIEIPNPRTGELETVEIYYVCPSGKR